MSLFFVGHNSTMSYLGSRPPPPRHVHAVSSSADGCGVCGWVGLMDDASTWSCLCPRVGFYGTWR